MRMSSLKTGIYVIFTYKFRLNLTNVTVLLFYKTHKFLLFAEIISVYCDILIA